MSPLPNLPRALLVRRMRAAAPELYTALRRVVDENGDARLINARRVLALVEGPAHGK